MAAVKQTVQIKEATMEIRTDVSDWQEEYMQAEPDVSGEDAAVQTQVVEKYHPLKMGRLLLVGRERGDSPEDILPPNKLLLNTGAAYAWTQKLTQRRAKVKIPGTDREISVREIVGDVPDQEDESDCGEGIVFWNDESAIERAKKYLLQRVTGHIYERFKAIAANGGDVQGAADRLKDSIDEMVTRLT